MDQPIAQMILCNSFGPVRLVTVTGVTPTGLIDAPTGPGGATERWRPDGRRQGADRRDGWRLVPASDDALAKLEEAILWREAGRLATNIDAATTNGPQLRGEELRRLVSILTAAHGIVRRGT